jgi:hypothetical protein
LGDQERRFGQAKALLVVIDESRKAPAGFRDVHA